MIALAWLAPIGALAVAAIVGTAIERALGRPWFATSVDRWPRLALIGLAAALALVLHPLSLVALAALLIATRGRSAPATERLGPFAWLVLAVGLVAALRPPLPVYWDEFVWLGKARLGADPLALRAASLDPDGTLVPRGYPPFAPLATAALGLFRADLPSLVAGAAGLTLLSLACALGAVPGAARLPWLLALATMPLVWIHLRSAYLDLAVGALVVGTAGLLDRAREGDRSALAGAIVAAFVVAGLKDEGAGHIAALAFAHVVVHRDQGSARRSALIAAASLLSFGTWRALLASHGVANADHALEAIGLANGGAIAREILRSACDFRSWGLAWPIVAGLVVVSLRRRVTREPALALTLAAVVLTTAIVCGSERLQTFALSGTLMNRLLVQLAPMAAWTIVRLWLAQRETTSNTAHGCQSR